VIQKRIRSAALIAIIALAGVVITLQAQDQAKKAAAPSSGKTEQASKMKMKGNGKMDCCKADSLSCSKDGKSCCADKKKQ